MNSLFKKIIISYLTLLATLKLKFFKGKIIGLAGCYGKSSAVDLIEQLLTTEYKVKSTNIGGKGLNTESGIPFVILNINPDKYRAIDWLKYSFQALINLFKPLNFDFIVLEMGVDSPGDMQHLTKHFRPDIGILLNSDTTHSANFETLHHQTGKSYKELIAYENGYVLARAKEAIFFNNDIPEVIDQSLRSTKNAKFNFSTSEPLSKITTFRPTLAGTQIEFTCNDSIVKITHPTPLLGEYKSTFELIIKLAEYFKINNQNTETVFRNFQLPPSRCSLFKGIKDTFILDSSYNSSFLPAKSALELLKQIAPKRRVAILGDMRELGEITEQEHKKLAREAMQNTDIVLTIGPFMHEFFKPEFEANKKVEQQIRSFDSTKDALEYLRAHEYDFLQSEDTILVKGSQNTLLLEIIIEELLADKSQVSMLSRRGKLYDEKRQALLV
jgi:UDP-N-acetylmuramoyl-tripeptide--D-alanyl-D-alanine ligase